MRIVIADQDKSFLESFREFLGVRGHEVAVATEGLTCLRWLRDFRPDVVALSNNLLWGGSDGVLSVMKEDPKLRNIPVLVMTENPSQPPWRIQPEMVSTVQGPFRHDDLIQRLGFLSLLGAVAKQHCLARVTRPQRPRFNFGENAAVRSPSC
jgi:CheY-like chemotaxis protein